MLDIFRRVGDSASGGLVVMAAWLLVVSTGCKSDEQKHLEEAMELHDQAYRILEDNVDSPDTAVTELTKLEESSRKARVKNMAELKEAMDKLEDSEKKAFIEDAQKKAGAMRNKMAEVVKRYPTDKQHTIKGLIMAITSERPPG